ncbi:hypothetical protein [Herbaspirillum sp. ST 5-3]|uniref:hypothetical protein n=1 Tax=Oxalobacteraceae TaxID=75682 RepID=UPI0010A38334|nr:hypothetical protein [Herbaspirillum sp. ST 5-3]
MKFGAIKSAVICVLGGALIAGCASSPSSSTVASTQKNISSGKIAAVETTAVVDQTTVGSSSGSGAVVTSASGGPSLITVQFDDGTQGRYVIDHPTSVHKVGEPVNVITDGDRITITTR